MCLRSFFCCKCCSILHICSYLSYCSFCLFLIFLSASIFSPFLLSPLVSPPFSFLCIYSSVLPLPYRSISPGTRVSRLQNSPMLHLSFLPSFPSSPFSSILICLSGFTNGFPLRLPSVDLPLPAPEGGRGDEGELGKDAPPPFSGLVPLGRQRRHHIRPLPRPY